MRRFSAIMQTVRRCLQAMRYIAVVTPSLLVAQASPAGPATGRLRGLVFDSLSVRPMPGALVQVVGESPSTFIGTATADAYGEYALLNVPAGRYTIGFQHPMLDSLGIEAPARAAMVRGGDDLRVDLAVPSPARLRQTLCGTTAGALILGFVRDVQTEAPLADVSVTGEWLEYVLGRTGLTGSRAHRTSQSFPTGFFALCQMPSPGTIVLRAGKGADSSGAVEVNVTAAGFVRRDLVLGAQALAGQVRLSGIVAARDGSPVNGAQVQMLEGPAARSNERGEWSIVGAPTGTRTLEVRAVGFYPDRRTLTVGAATPRMESRLETLKAVLDTMKVIANLPPSVVTEFNNRRRSYPGRFLGPEDIARRGPTQVSDIFKSIPGVYLETITPADTVSIFTSSSSTSQSSDNQMRVVMKGTFAEKCLPPVWLNGMQLPEITAPELDGLMQPKDLIGIEVYTGTQVPGQFRNGNNNCGAVVIWRRR